MLRFTLGVTVVFQQIPNDLFPHILYQTEQSSLTTPQILCAQSSHTSPQPLEATDVLMSQ